MSITASVFVYYKQAFESVNQEQLMKTLKKYGVPAKNEG